MTTDEIIGSVNHLSQILMAYKELIELPDCNTCAIKKDCVHAPRAGQMVRINCFMYKRRRNENA